ncbi:MAG: hypothetical protein EA394_08745 [Bacteroidia bacterium]|nr:MAG: hypothetical protein EA394_08745 [Bacteroidia bacterium]
MKNSHLQRNLVLKENSDRINQLEWFVEKICDDFYIYDQYYANILSALSLVCDLEESLSTTYQQTEMQILFNKDKNGLYFHIKLNEKFLDIAGLYEKATLLDGHEQDAPEIDENTAVMHIIMRLTDKLVVNQNEQSITLFFRVTGINEMLGLQRVQLLEKYYADMVCA